MLNKFKKRKLGFQYINTNMIFFELNYLEYTKKVLYANIVALFISVNK